MSGSVDPIFYDFRATILRHFDSLFTKHGFGLVAELNYRHGEYQALIAASSGCQVKFVLEQEIFELFVGRTESPRSYSDTIEGIEWWTSFWMLMSFEDMRDPASALRLSAPNSGGTLDMEIERSARLLEHYIARVQKGISSGLSDEWWTGYRAFRAARGGAALPQP